MNVRRAAAVAVGAAIGASIRWALVRALGPDGIDAALLSVNVAGCFALGVVSRLPPDTVHTATRDLLGAGLCAGLTTWSSLALRTAADLRSGEWLAAGALLSANLAIGVGAAVVGHMIGARRWRTWNADLR